MIVLKWVGRIVGTVVSMLVGAIIATAVLVLKDATTWDAVKAVLGL